MLFPFTDCQVQNVDARCRQISNEYSSTVDIANLSQTDSELMGSSLAGSTKHLYLKIWTDFNKFCVDHLSATDAVLPIPINTLSLYLASLFIRGYAPLTICTYNSALSYWHKLNNAQDPTSSFFILKLLQGAKWRRIRFDSITRSILNRLVTALN